MKTILNAMVMASVLSTSTIANADESKELGHFRAFNGVPAMEVSVQELNEVSGDGWRDTARNMFIKGWQTSTSIVSHAWNAGVDVGNIWTNRYCRSCR